jgi:hypothetical protein
LIINILKHLQYVQNATDGHVEKRRKYDKQLVDDSKFLIDLTNGYITLLAGVVRCHKVHIDITDDLEDEYIRYYTHPDITECLLLLKK